MVAVAENTQMKQWRSTSADWATVNPVIGDGEWLESTWPSPWGPQLALAASGGWRDDTFTAELRLVETPHTIDLCVDPAEGTVRLDWRLVPLSGPDPLNSVGFPF